MNPEAERLLGWTARELRGKDMHRLIHSHEPDGSPFPDFCCGVLGVLRNGGVCRTEDDAFLCKGGSLMPVSFVASAIMENGKAVASVVAFQDISRRKQAERDLLESREQLRELLSYSQTVREEERTRIARELHDELGQMLTGVKLDATWLATRLSGERPDVTKKVASMSRLIDETLDAMRRVAADLRPMMLDDLGLTAALEWLVEDFGERTGINIRLEMDMEETPYRPQDEEGLDARVSTAAFRIVQECLTNVARHAQTEQAAVSLECRDSKLLIMVSDNGKGMDLANGKGCKSLGIIGMRERAHSLRGDFHLFSTPGGGTTVLAIIPVKLDDFAGLDE
jgi:two-component system sensor histidine kinase UhpB